jgi:hypothetical protein
MWIVVLIILLVALLLLVFNKKRVFTNVDPYHIVVARYNEDPWSWLSKDDPYVKVYNKGSKDSSLPLPNIGRESHTYLTYIVDNYDRLPNVVFFTQGAPDHTGGHPIEYFTSISTQCSDNHHTTKGPYYEFDSDGFLSKYHGVLYKSDLSFFDWFERYVSQSVDPRGNIVWYMGATFSVKRENILSRSRDYYIDLLNQFPKDHANPEIGHYFERSWYYIFNCHDHL